MQLVIGGIHQERQGDLERIIDFRAIERQFKAGRNPRQRRQNAKTETGGVKVEIADRLDEGAVEPDFLFGFAQRGIEWRGIARIDLAAGKGDLTGMAVEMRGAQRQQHGRLGARHHRHQHRRRPQRKFRGDHRPHLIGVGIAAGRQQRRIGERRRHIEAQPLLGALEKLRGVDAQFSGTGRQHRAVHIAALTSSASAIAKNAPLEATPNSALPSTIRSSPLSTRS